MIPRNYHQIELNSWSPIEQSEYQKVLSGRDERECDGFSVFPVIGAKLYDTDSG